MDYIIVYAKLSPACLYRFSKYAISTNVPLSRMALSRNVQPILEPKHERIIRRYRHPVDCRCPQLLVKLGELMLGDRGKFRFLPLDPLTTPYLLTNDQGSARPILLILWYIFKSE